MFILGKIRKSCIKYIEKLVKANEKNFGHQKLDCCDLNKKQQQNASSIFIRE